jgi:predicted Zn-dependent protease
MEPGRCTPRFKKRKRAALALALSLIALGLGAAVVRHLWQLRVSRQDPTRLGLLYAAWNEFAAKRYDRATSILDRRAAEVTPTPLDWMLRARIAESQGRLSEALGHLRHIPDSDPIGGPAWLKAGQIELARGRARAAEAAFHRALALDPDQIQPRRELAYLYALQRRRAECDAQFRALADRMPLDYVLAFAWCQNFCRIWDPDASRKVLSRFVAEDPDDRPSRLALATSFQLTHQSDDAEAALRPLPDSDPDARALRVQLAIDRGEIAVAEGLARGGPADHMRLNALRGQLALYGKDPRRAAAHFRAALRRDPEDRDAIHGLGQALRQVGDPGAEELLRVASRHDELKRTIQASVTTIRTDPKLFDKLGAICESIGRLAEARAWYQLAIRRDALDAEAQQALSRLDRAAFERGAEPGSGRDEKR